MYKVKIQCPAIYCLPAAFKTDINQQEGIRATIWIVVLYQRTGDPECEFIFDNIKILDSAKYDYKLRYVESIILKYEKQNLNTQERSIPLNVLKVFLLLRDFSLICYQNSVCLIV